MRLILATLLLAAALPAAAERHVYDRAGVLPAGDIPRFEQYMGFIQRESDVDVRFVFVPGVGARSIEEAATETMDEMKIGGRSGQQRGLLLLFDTAGRRLKVEVDYGLEGYFPDAFVSYLVHEHAKEFFQSGDLSLGLRTLLTLLQHRIREAVLGMDFDPRALPCEGHARADLCDVSRVARAPRLRSGRGALHCGLARLSLPLPAHGPLPAIHPPGRVRQVPPHRPARLPRLLVFTGTPFVSPHFFVKDGEVWRMDMAAEVRDTVERVGGAYTWDYRGTTDEYSKAFEDLLTKIQGYRRFKDGDNRALPIRGDKR